MKAWRTTVKVNTVPVPASSDHSVPSSDTSGTPAPGDGGWCRRPVQRWTTRRWAAAASHHPTVSALAAGIGISSGNQRSVIAVPAPSALVGTPAALVTRQVSAPSTWQVDSPRSWRTPFDDVVEPVDVGLGQAAPVGVRGEGPVGPGQRARRGEGAALAAPAEPEVLQAEEHEPGEVVVDLGHVDVARAHAGPGPQPGRHPPGPGAGVVVVGHVDVGVLAVAEARRRALGRAQDRHGSLAQSAARSAVVITTAQAPSFSRQQSKSRKGSDTMRDAR